MTIFLWFVLGCSILNTLGRIKYLKENKYPRQITAVVDVANLLGDIALLCWVSILLF